MLATMTPANPFDALFAKIEAFLSNENESGFGTLTTTADAAEVEVTLKPKDGESFRAFATRVMQYADGATIEWNVQNRKVPYARVRRTLN
jgi:hypothetical protein